MLFKLIDGKDFFELNPEARVFPEFNERTSAQMWFIALVADYDSPLRTLPEETRREKAAIAAGYTNKEADGRYDRNHRDMVGGKVETVETAIKKYKEIQWDEDQEMLAGVDRQIQEITRLQAMDKEIACTVVKTKRHKGKGSEETKYLDTRAMVKMVSDVTNMINELPKLRKTKKELLAQMKTETPVELLTTYTAADLDTTEESTVAMSTLDQFMMRTEGKP